jgi:hypothetical protein
MKGSLEDHREGFGLSLWLTSKIDNWQYLKFQ